MRTIPSKRERDNAHSCPSAKERKNERGEGRGRGGGGGGRD